jgi:Tol biopolymer transport system component
VTESAGRRSDRSERWDARFRLASFPFLVRRAARLVAIALLLIPSVSTLRAQGPSPRPWLDWHTTQTEHFVFHYPSAYREWTFALADRIETLRTEVAEVVGFTPRNRVHIVVDDPINDANGTAYPALDAPTIVLWPVSPDPRSDIGDYAVWQELLATHEFAHVAHLTRPTRNRWQRFIRSLSPVPLGPITTKVPRWVTEGYATYVEGRVSGSGRPNHAWRAAILRQFALEGRLPSYGQLNATGGWRSGQFAYLAGSAFLEWLARREGDSSVVALWRRLTSKTDRSFTSAFTGVYGGSPAELYGRFTVELTADAVEIARALRRQQLTEGELVQRLVRETGDPAIAPDGRFVALTIRKERAPSALVVWKTEPEPDTLAANRRAEQLRRDPEDVPDRFFYPPAKKVVATLVASDGYPYETPRWFADNRRLLLTRNMPAHDGTFRPDLFVWSAEDGALQRVTRGAALRDADPSADGKWAAAVRCEHGWCDLVRVDLATREVRVLRAGSVRRNYYRPRISRKTGEIVVAEQLGDRWRVARVSPVTGELRYADPDDGANRYDATYDVDGATIVTTSERGGFVNLERLSPDGTGAVPITRVTGAAVAADVAPDGEVWYLNLQSSGYDLRRLRPDSVRIDAPLPTVVIGDTLSSVLPPRRPSGVDSGAVVPSSAPPHTESGYGLGPSRFRYVPLVSAGFGGTTAGVAIVRSDPVGRLGIQLLGVAGSSALPVGGSFTLTSRTGRSVVGVSAWYSHEAPSRELPAALEAGLDLERGGGALRLDRRRVRDAGELTGTLAALAEVQQPSMFERSVRRAVLGGFGATLRQVDDDVRYVMALDGLGELGASDDGRYARQRSSLLFGTARTDRPLFTTRLAYGTVGGGGGASRERFVVGGFRSPLIDPLYDARRIEAPAYPAGSSVGTTFASYRIGVPVEPVEAFYAGATTDFFQTQRRSYGVEVRQRVPAIAALGTPEASVLAGFARAQDDPVRGEWRLYLSVALRP